MAFALDGVRPGRPVAIVTGGGTGMGRATAAELASDHVVIVERREAVFTAAAEAIGATSEASVSAFPADLTEVDQVEALVGRIVNVSSEAAVSGGTISGLSS